MTRVPIKGDEELAPESRAIFDGMRARGSSPPDLYRLLANAPELLTAWTHMAWPLRTAAYSDRALRELLIMRTAQATGADYEWKHHWSMALGAGVSPAKLNALGQWEGSPLFTPEERAALRMADAVIAHRVTDLEMEDLLRRFDSAAVVQLVLTVAFYLCVGRVADALGLQVEPGYEDVPDLSDPAA